MWRVCIGKWRVRLDLMARRESEWVFDSGCKRGAELPRVQQLSAFPVQLLSRRHVVDQAAAHSSPLP
jgi:hypothetical protein